MKTQNLFKSILGVAVIATQLFIMSCDSAGNPSALVGRWLEVAGETEGEVLELLSDGTGIVTQNSKGVAITWKTEKDRFYLTASGEAKSLSYKQQGSMLTLTNDNGKVYEYWKCKKDCKEAVNEWVKAKFASKVKKGSFSDGRDGKKYKTVKFDNQTWMAENLNFNANGSKCYENQESNCQKYGRLYNWETAKSACPEGWHLPSDEEWGILVDFAGGNSEAGTVLKASSGWEDNGNGSDAFGFSALPGGAGDPGGDFGGVGKGGVWWSATVYGTYAWYRDVRYYYAKVGRDKLDRTHLFSVRCVQD